MNKKLVLSALKNSLGVAVYIIIVAFVMQNGQSWFGQDGHFTSVIAVLLLGVLSSAEVGSLIFVRPVMLYLDGAKKNPLRYLLTQSGSSLFTR